MWRAQNHPGPTPLRMSLADLEKAGVESVRIVPRGAPAAHMRLRCCGAEKTVKNAHQHADALAVILHFHAL